MELALYISSISVQYHICDEAVLTSKTLPLSAGSVHVDGRLVGERGRGGPPRGGGTVVLAAGTRLIGGQMCHIHKHTTSVAWASITNTITCCY